MNAFPGEMIVNLFFSCTLTLFIKCVYELFMTVPEHYVQNVLYNVI